MAALWVDPEIRCATEADIDVLGDLARRSVADPSVGHYTEAQIAAAAAAITVPDLDLIEDGTLFVAVIDDRIVGCGGWSKRAKLFTGGDSVSGEGLFLDPAREPARIRAFFVEPELAGCGIGRAIYQRCAEEARTQSFDRLELIATLPGVPFYERLGFVIAEWIEITLVGDIRLPTARMIITLSV